ncbi:hypothetical protein [Pseudodesulfovibrio sp.]|uniref:hypothetical protein n=1 Tax=unclassified Pseudodesulfovibrio TaxID=2661612 RepID=UPI003B0053F3
MKTELDLELTMCGSARTGFNTLLQRGFYMTCRAGMSVREFMREVLGYDDLLIDNDVRTVFLNSSPLDGLDTTHLQDGDRLALGSAMPGLVGICMGRDNPYREFRSSIGLVRHDAVETGEIIRVFVKIFSVLAVDTGADILQRGIETEREPLIALLKKGGDNLLSEGEAGAAEILDSLRRGKGTVRLQVRFV